MQAAGLQLEHRIWTDHWLPVCQPCIQYPGVGGAPRHHFCYLTEQTSSTMFTDTAEYNIAWSKTHQGSHSTQVEGSMSAICARGNPVIQWCGNSPRVHRAFMQQPVTTGLTKTSDKQMAKGKCRNVTKRNQGNMAASKPNSLRTGCPGFPNIPENLDLDLESQVMLLLEE